MAGQRAAGAGRGIAVGFLFLLTASFLVTGLPVSGAGHAAAPTPAARHSGAALASASHPALPPPSGTTNGTMGPAYNWTPIAPASSTTTPCYWQNYSFGDTHFCYQETQSPTLVNLPNGHLGLGYSIYTTTGPGCNASGGSVLTSWTTTNIAWAASTTNGTTWGAPQIIGSVNCHYPSAAEPSFSTDGAGAVYGTFVASNQTQNSTSTAPRQPVFSPDWNDTANATLGFVHSANNGTTWANASLVPGVVGVERPQVAVRGSTVYIVYIHIPMNISTTVYPLGTYSGFTFTPLYSPALQVDLVYSTNSGTTWHGPYPLPGMNASMGNWSTAPSIAVNASGSVAVAYATNRSCLQYCTYLPGAIYGEDIVLATSTTNGSTWGAPVTIAPKIGENYYYANYNDNYIFYNYQYPWQSPPETAIAFGSGSTLYVAYAGTHFIAPGSYANFQYTGVFESVSTNGGATWTNSTVAAPANGAGNYDNTYSPSIDVSGGTVYVAYVAQNNTYCYIPPCSPFDGGYSSWLAQSPNGLSWTNTYTGLSQLPRGTYSVGPGFQAFTSSVVVAASGTPVTATTLAGQDIKQSGGLNGSIPITIDTALVNVTIAFRYTGPTTYIHFVEGNLSAGTSWGVTLDGYATRANTTTINVSNVPLHLGVLIGILPQPAAYLTIEVPKLSQSAYLELSGPTVVYVNYSISYGFQFSIQPQHLPYTDLTTSFGGTYYDVYSNGGIVGAFPSLPWYFPKGATLQFGSYGTPPITYWNGTGAGSYTGTGSQLNLTAIGPVNETGWAGSYGVYVETFKALGLPSTSTYSFDFNGATHSTAATSWTNVSGVGTGGYTVTGITATSSTVGWQYFGSVVGGSNTIVVPAQPVASLQFAYVNTASSVGTVTFHATGFGTGTVWSVEFNGTFYSASTPWLNVSTRPGTYPWAVGSAVAANASVGYAPVGVGGTVSVTTGSTVNISYTAAYRVAVLAGLGGVVSGAGNHWLASGTHVNYTAVASNGYTFGGWTGSGTGSYTGTAVNASVTVGGAITETASFYPLPSARFNLTFHQAGIPSGAWWTVYLNGVGYSSNTTVLTVSNLLSCAAGLPGQYHLSIPYAYDNATGATRYSAVNPPAQLCTNGGLVQLLTFAPQYEVSVASTPGGTAFLANGNARSNVSLWATPMDNVLLSAVPNGNAYNFGGWNGTGSGSYTGSAPSTALSAGGPITEFATFVPVKPVAHPTYTETFLSSEKFAAGTAWSVTVSTTTQTTTYAAVGNSVSVPGLAPTVYTVTVSGATSADGLTKWSPSTPKFTVHVAGNGSQSVVFGKPSYWVSVGGSSGGSVHPASGWYGSGTTVTLNASPDLGQQFVNWTGSGNGSYSGNASGPTVTVTAPISEFATFQPVAPAAKVITSVWQSSSTWAILGLAGLLVGLVLGVALRKLRAAPAGSPVGTSDTTAAGSGRGTTTTEGSP